jgi:hypothetical protein
MFLACVGQCGCTDFESTRPYQDQHGYSRAVGDAEKSSALLNVVRLRYADSGPAAPAETFTSVQYHRTWFWIDEDDFDNKLAFSVLQILLALARTEITPGAIVTIPAR